MKPLITQHESTKSKDLKAWIQERQQSSDPSTTTSRTSKRSGGLGFGVLGEGIWAEALESPKGRNLDLLASS